MDDIINISIIEEVEVVNISIVEEVEEVNIVIGESGGGDIPIEHKDTTNRDALNSHTGEAISLNPAGFTKNLDNTIINPQLFADKFDKMDFGGDDFILKLVMAANTQTLEITQDKNGNAINLTEGATFEIVMNRLHDDVGAGSITRLSVNDFTGGYVYSVTTDANGFPNNSANHKRCLTSWRFTLIGGELQGLSVTSFQTTTNTNQQAVYGFRTVGLNATAITKITLTTPNSPRLMAGSTVILKRIR